MSTKLEYTCDTFRYTLRESDNEIIEGIDDDLENNFSDYKISFGKIAPISLKPDITIRLPMVEAYAGQANVFNYVRLTSNSDVDTYQKSYWFVRGIRRIANETIEVSLHMDVLNTFSNLIERGLDPRTFTIREHRDRFTKKDLTYPVAGDDFYKVIDPISEGISVNKIRTGNTAVTLSDGFLSGLTWFLIYRTRNNLTADDYSNPIDCFLCASQPVKIANEATGTIQTLNYSDLSAATYYYCIDTENPGFSITFVSGNTSHTFTQGGTVSIQAQDYYVRGYYLFKGDSYMTLRLLVSKTATSDVFTIDEPSVLIPTSVTLTVLKQFRLLTYETNQFHAIAEGDQEIRNSGSTGAIYVSSFASLSRTDSRIVKIIELPYPPCSIASAGSGTSKIFVFDSAWSWSDGLMKLNDSTLNTEFLCPFTRFNTTPLNNFVESDISGLDKTSMVTEARFISDPKLLHSDFYVCKFIYDNFAINFKYERLVLTGSAVPSFWTAFKPTNTINSNLLFDFGLYNATYQNDQDYPVITATRNNETPVFSNAYVNYIKNGYNFDKKSKAIETSARWIGLATSIVGTAVGAVTGQVAVTAMGAVSAVNSLVSAVSSQAQADNSISEKLQELKAQSSSVVGTDDIDIMAYYSGNRLRFMTYEPTPEFKDRLNDLFFYYGYLTNKNKIPSFNSRFWFNFIQCKPVWTRNATLILGDYMEEINTKLNNGVTVLHEVNLSTSAENDYRWSQGYENWEVWFVNHA